MRRCSRSTHPAWTAGQDGDGYSWICQILPFMEENTLYEKIDADGGHRRLGKVRRMLRLAKAPRRATLNSGYGAYAIRRIRMFLHRRFRRLFARASR